MQIFSRTIYLLNIFRSVIYEKIFLMLKYIFISAISKNVQNSAFAAQSVFLAQRTTYLGLNSKSVASKRLLVSTSSVLNVAQLVDLAVYDRPGKKSRFTVLYLLLNINYSARTIFSVQTKETLSIPSVTNIFLSAG